MWETMCCFQKLGNWQEQSLEVLHTHTYVTDPHYKITTENLGKGGKIKIEVPLLASYESNRSTTLT